MLTTPKLKELCIYKDPNLFVSYHYYLLQAHRVSRNSAKRLRRNTIKTLCRVCDDLYRACTFAWCILIFVSFLLLTGRCYNAETSVILFLLDRAFA